MSLLGPSGPRLSRSKCADAIAKGGCSLIEDLVVFDVSPSVEISSFVNSDASRLYYCRLLATTVASSLLMLYPFNQKKKKKKIMSLLPT